MMKERRAIRIYLDAQPYAWRTIKKIMDWNHMKTNKEMAKAYGFHSSGGYIVKLKKKYGLKNISITSNMIPISEQKIFELLLSGWSGSQVASRFARTRRQQVLDICDRAKPYVEEILGKELIWETHKR